MTDKPPAAISVGDEHKKAAKCEGACATNRILNAVNILVNLLLGVASVFSFIEFASIQSMIVSGYLVVFAFAGIIMEVTEIPAVMRVMSFYYSLIGRGFWFVFLGCLCLSSPSAKQVNLVSGVIGIIVGIVLFIIRAFNPHLSEIKSLKVPVPDKLREPSSSV
eukprot:TRINITY_DN762_c0_g1_i1.p1 TRINITY_DN762_c0_g1~~TRINITY_DN762_c0_g1_i1.p1  ORF type:complete len:185 (+),score=51.14 TRINITY_DN762_c0_g1_i1:69-557(+)